MKMIKNLAVLAFMFGFLALLTFFIANVGNQAIKAKAGLKKYIYSTSRHY